MKAECTECTRPVGDQAYLCRDCLERLAQVIGDLPALLDELDITATRQAVIGSGDEGRKSAETALPFNWNAAALQDTARNTITSWSRLVHEDSGAELPLLATAGALCAYLITSLSWLRSRKEVTELSDELGYLRSAVLAAIDRAAPLWFAGPCDECGADLYCKPEAADVTCRTDGCGLVYDVPARREWLRAALGDKLANATTIARALTSLDEPVTPSIIRNLAARHLIYPHSVDRDGNPMYRIGEVTALLVDRRLKRQQKVSA